MLGLIKKDLLMIRGNIKIIGIIIVVFAIMGLIEGENYGISFIPAFVCVMMMSTFSYDEFNKTDAYITTFPCGRKSVVKAKYIATIALFILATLISLVFSLSVGIVKNNLDLQYCLENSLGVGLGVVLVQSIFYPMIYKFGIEKSRIGIFVAVFGIVGIITLLSQFGFKINIPPFVTSIFDACWFIVIPLITILIIYISYRISARIYSKKEF